MAAVNSSANLATIDLPAASSIEIPKLLGQDGSQRDIIVGSQSILSGDSTTARNLSKTSAKFL